MLVQPKPYHHSSQMKGLYLTLSILLLSLRLAAQEPGSSGQQAKPAVQPPPALEFRDVNGIVRDENDDPVPGALVFLQSPLDSMYTTTNNNGVFIFKKVRRAGFYITVSGPGLPTTVKLLRNNDLSKQIVLDPIELKPPKATELKEVTINGKPTIIYKQDTVEYKASDYKVRDGDRLDELLKKMEGFDVGRDGTLLYQGQKVEKARLNGRDFLGNNVAAVIQTLPADIIEKAQVIDDYGEQAARTGIKDTDPKKMLNVTTKPDRSIGTLFSPNAQGGNDERYNANVSITHLNANRQIGITGRINNTQTGVASGINGGGGAGTTFTASPGISYSDQWNKLKLTSNYNYNLSDNNSINKSFGENYSVGQTPTSRNTSFFTTDNSKKRVEDSHRGSVQLTYDFDKSNFLRIEPTFNYSNDKVTNTTYNDRINYFDTGFEHLTLRGNNNENNTNTTVGITALFQHYFKKLRRNMSIQLGVNNSDTKANGLNYTTYSFFKDETQNTQLRPDSVAHLQTRRTSNNTSLNTTITFLEPLTPKSQLEFSGRIGRTLTDNVAKQDTLLPSGQLQELTRLSNIFNTALTEARLQFNYTYNGDKINLSAGGSLLPINLTGTKVNNNNNQSVSSSISNFRVIPVLRFTYIWSTTERAVLSYSGSNRIPDFQQLQPFTDRSDPIYIVTGNPNLKPTFTNNLSASYNNYIANSKTTISLTITASEYKNRVIINQILRPELISTNPAQYRTTYETTYLNVDGAHSLGLNYTFGKQLADRRYNLLLNGSVNYNYDLGMSNGIQYHTTTWRINQRFGPKINPNESIEINPYIGYDVQRSFTSTPAATPTLRQTTSLTVDGRFFLGDWRLNYSASKNYVTGLGSLNSNPLVLNAGVERQLSKKNSLFLTFNVYDILKQNNFVQQTITPQSVTNTLSNALSRYFMVGIRATFQKWSGRPQRNGKELNRKGDGSFIY